MSDLRNSRNSFIVETCLLSKAAPQQWAAFMQAFEQYATQKIEESVSAAPDHALVAQGRAQAYVALRKDFREIESLFKQVTK